MKKLITMIMVFILLTTLVLTGCKSKDDSKETRMDNASERKTATKGNTEKKEEISTSQNDKADISSSLKDGDISNSKYGSKNDVVIEEKDAAYTISDSYKGVNSMDKAFKYAGYPYEPEMQNTEEYSEFDEVGFKDTTGNPLSTFSIDVDTASYAQLRKAINYGNLPGTDEVRIEEMLNYFSYEYDEPKDGKPFSINTEIGKCPWEEEHYLLKVGIQGKNVDTDALPKSNLVFLIDVSGSMDEEDKLPLLKNAFTQLVEELGENDRISIVVYAGDSGVVLDSVSGSEKSVIIRALKSLRAGGSTAGASGIELAYELADKNFIYGGNNRVILATDGDFNVGPSSQEQLENIITEKRESGIYLSVIGFGSGNLKDNKMELLADKGNGNYSYIDSPKEARKVLVDEMSGTLLTIAKDVKIQLEFNPNSVESYRLIGYENRALANEDFKDDTVDAGELGAGHSVTAIYEIIPGRASSPKEDQEALKYQSQGNIINTEYLDEITEVRLRYKEPDEDTSEEIKQVVSFINTPVSDFLLSDDFYFAAAVAEFGMILRDSEYRGNATIDSVLELSEKGLGEDIGDYRLEFVEMVERYRGYFEYQW